MDPAIQRELASCWADFSRERMRRALHASVALFDLLAKRTSAAMGVETFDSDPVQGEIARLLDLAPNDDGGPDEQTAG
jgi:hypothetical protein